MEESFPFIKVPVFVIEASLDSRVENEYIDKFLSAIETSDELKVKKSYPHEHVLLYNGV